MKTQLSRPTPVMTPAVYLNRLVKLKKALHALDDYEAIAICDNDLRVQVYRASVSWLLRRGKPSSEPHGIAGTSPWSCILSMRA